MPGLPRFHCSWEITFLFVLLSLPDEVLVFFSLIFSKKGKRKSLGGGAAESHFQACRRGLSLRPPKAGGFIWSDAYFCLRLGIWVPGNKLRIYFPSVFPTRKATFLFKSDVLMSLWTGAWCMLPGQYIFASLKAGACPSTSPPAPRVWVAIWIHFSVLSLTPRMPSYHKGDGDFQTGKFGT